MGKDEKKENKDNDMPKEEIENMENEILLAVLKENLIMINLNLTYY